MKFCKIENGKVTNIISAEQSFIDTLPDTYFQSEDAFIGQGFDGINLIVEEEVLPTLEENKIKKSKLNTDNAQRLMSEEFSSSPDFEIKSFSTQQREYEAYILDNTAPTPFIDGIILPTETKAEFMAKVGANLSFIQGIQKQMRQTDLEIKNCTTQNELDMVVI